MADSQPDNFFGDDNTTDRLRRRPYPAIVPPQDEAVGDVAELRKHRAVLARLREWNDWNEARRKSPLAHVLSKINVRRRPVCPCKQELLQLALYFFPSRATLKAVICDFGDGKFERSEQDLGRIDQCKHAE